MEKPRLSLETPIQPMSDPTNQQPRRSGPYLLIALACMVLLTAWILMQRNGKLRTAADANEPVVAEAPVHPVVSVDPKPAFPDSPVAHPLAVVRTSAKHEWTSEDAKDPKVIERIAHNPEEAIRLIEENDRIKRRQLVYRKETVPMLLEQAQGKGGSLKSLSLPGLDGKEVEVEVTEVHLMDGTNGGCVNGRVKGRLNSMVSVGFSNGCESFNILSPDEGVFLTADAREPGEVLVKEIDPNVYGRPPESNTPCVVDLGKLGPGHKADAPPSK